MNVHVTALANRHDHDRTDTSFGNDVVAGLSQRQKQLSPKYFYDEAGSHLFEQITLLPEYYPTRTELRILRDRAADIAAQIPPDAALIEFGAGATTKVRLMLAARQFAAYVPVDISGAFLNGQADVLRKDFPQLAVHPVVADFTAPFVLPAEVRHMPKVGFFPGSTIGNFDPEDAEKFLRSARNILGPGAILIIGVDLEKDQNVLEAAYNDAAGVTAKFNQNVLLRINHELGGDFDIPRFVHRSIYNRDRHRIEMHLISSKAQKARLLGQTFHFNEGESIHTESSYKYSVERFQALARTSGWTPSRVWTDHDAMFSVHALVTADEA
jgi:dimethylhistidine N-methyltransferase